MSTTSASNQGNVKLAANETSEEQTLLQMPVGTTNVAQSRTINPATVPLPDEEASIRLRTSSVKSSQGSTGACDACRMRKACGSVRCIANENALSSKCQRCARTNRECVYTTHSKTRRRKRTDTRVKELEEKVRGLSMLLEGKTAMSSVLERRSSSVDKDEEVDVETISEGLSPVNAGDTPVREYVSQMTSHHFPDSTSSIMNQREESTEPPYPYDMPDVIDKGILTMDMADKLYSRYITQLMPRAPAVPLTCTATELRNEKPALFLAVLAAGAGASDPMLNLKLNQEIQHLYATQISIHGRKSLELVQALCVSILWTYPPRRAEELKFHQQIHMAATMSLDIGLGKRPRPPKDDSWSSREPSSPFIKNENEKPLIMDHLIIKQKGRADSSSVESRRALLACYVFCTSVSMSLRLPNMLRFTSWMAECVDFLEASPDAAPTDKLFVSWVRLQHIVEEAAMNLGLDSDETVSLGEERVQLMLKTTEKQLESWKKDATALGYTNNTVLDITYHVNQVYLHEIALHPDHDAEDFRPPFSILSKPVSQFKLTPAYLNAILTCVSSSEALLNNFLNLDSDTIRTLPTLTYARVIYCLVILMKLSISLANSESGLSKVLDPQDLSVDHYLSKTLQSLKAASDLGDSKTHILSAQFAAVLAKLQTWYQKIKAQQAPQPSEQQPGKEQEQAQYQAQQPKSQFKPMSSNFLPSSSTHRLAQEFDFSSPPQTNGIPFLSGLPKAPTAPPYDTASSMQSMQAPAWPNQNPLRQQQQQQQQQQRQQQQQQQQQQPLPSFTSYGQQDPLFAPSTPFDFPMDMDPTLFSHFVDTDMGMGIGVGVGVGVGGGWMTDSNGFDYEGMAFGSGGAGANGEEGFGWGVGGVRH